MIRVRHLLGHVDSVEFAGRRRDPLLVDWADARRRRLRRDTRDGADIAIDLPRGVYLEDGAVLDDDGERVVVVVRSSSPVLVVRFEPALSPSARLRAAAIVGHAFGNQHVPIEVAEDEIRVPLTTSAEVALTTVAALGLPGVIATVANLPIACRVALNGSESAHAHHAGAASPPGHHDHHHDHDHGAL